MPTISVIMSVHNSAAYLDAAVRSILAQTFADFEFIVVDDGSTDNSAKILAEFAERDPRIRVETRANKGLTKSLNEAIALSTGEFIARMDADDIAVGWRFEKQFAYMQKHPECVLLGAQVVVIDPYGMALYQSQYPLDHESIDAALMLGKGGTIRHPVAMMRREAIVKSGGYRKQYQWAEDVDLFLLLA